MDSKISEEDPASCACNQDSDGCGGKPSGLEMLPIYHETQSDTVCCGPPAGPASSPHERPGYTLCGFVEGFHSTPAGNVPVVKTGLDRHDRLGTLAVRLGVGRNNYMIAPGLYAVGRPDGDAPVLVTANYKLSFDHLRRNLAGEHVWVLVLDTRGINVWCAAGKGTFGTAELINRVLSTRLAQIVRHRRLILPQLGATGVAAHQVKKGCGFEAVWGPVAAKDLKAFLTAGQKAEPGMRRVTFTLPERLVLVPVELSLLRRPLLWTALVIFLLSGIGTPLFSFAAAWQRGWLALGACFTGIAAGAVLVPLLLPWIPGRAFAVKGALAGLLTGLMATLWAGTTFWSTLALVLLTTTVSSYLAMNFTGSTPFTSPSGVEKEMRRAIPLQLVAILAAAGLWVAAAFA